MPFESGVFGRILASILNSNRNITQQRNSLSSCSLTPEYVCVCVSVRMSVRLFSNSDLHRNLYK